MSEEHIELYAQRCLQEFDEAGESPEIEPLAVGRTAIEALDAFINFWSEKPFMKWKAAEGGDDAMREYAERQISWATHEKDRILGLIGPPS